MITTDLFRFQKLRIKHFIEYRLRVCYGVVRTQPTGAYVPAERVVMVGQAQNKQGGDDVIVSRDSSPTYPYRRHCWSLHFCFTTPLSHSVLQTYNSSRLAQSSALLHSFNILPAIFIKPQNKFPNTVVCNFKLLLVFTQTKINFEKFSIIVN